MIEFPRMIILAIETSCDETAIALVEAGGSLSRPRFNVLSSVVSSQIKVHAPFGGVVPNLAKREHQRNLTSVLVKALIEGKLLEATIKKQESRARKKNKVKIPDSRFKILDSILEREPELLKRFKKYILPLKAPKIDLIAVTEGPGLEPALWMGVNFAKALSCLWKKPLIGVDHLEGHILSNWLNPIAENQKSKIKNQNLKIQFPALCLIVSGGHTQLVLMEDFGKFKIIGETRDDAAGEAFDKVAKMLGLGFPGGPPIAAAAAKFPISNFQFPIEVKLPRPMINTKDYDFSFSGLKTAVLYLLKDLTKTYSLKELAPPVAREFQQAVVDVLIAKTINAAKEFKVKTVLLGGGVAANKELRRQLAQELKRKLPNVAYVQPALDFTTDNAAMIGAAAYVKLKIKRATWRELKNNWKRLRAISNLKLS